MRGARGGRGSVVCSWFLALGALAVLAASVSPLPAWANGRYPQAQAIVEQPGTPARLWLRTTWGLVTSSDAGQSWRWICEQAAGYGGSEDPALAVTGDGRLLLGLLQGLVSSTDAGCDFSSVSTALSGRLVVDLSVEQRNPERALALISMSRGAGSFLNEIHRSSDGGTSWATVGPELGTDLVALTLDSAPSDPTRLYASAVVSNTATGAIDQGALLSSIDDGASWQRHLIPGASIELAPFIAAIDPLDPNKLFIRMNGLVEDALLYSDDAGATFREILRGRAELYGFALSPDGATVLAGFGDPRDRPDVDERAFGIWRSSTTDFRFERIFDRPVSCLLWTEAGIYACAKQAEAGFELGRSRDFATSFEPLLTLEDALGPLECPAETATGRSCPALWPAVCQETGFCPRDGGAAGGRGAGGSTASEPSAGADAAGSCACSAVAGGARRALAAFGLLAALVFFRRRGFARSPWKAK